MKKTLGKKMFIYFTCFLLFTGLNSCTKTSGQKEPPLDPKNMDLSVNPGDDFFKYANGTWMKNNPIPDEFSRYSAFELLIDRNYDDLIELLKDASSQKSEPGSIQQKIGDFYACGMDSAKIEADGITPLKDEMDKIQKIRSAIDIQREIAYLHSYGVSSLFTFYAGQDEKNSDMVIAQLGQGGLGLPDRDYYLKDDARSKEIRQEYINHITKMFVLLGDDNQKSSEIAHKILQFETRLAKASMSRLDRRDPHKTYHKMNLTKLSRISRRIDWTTYFNNIGLANPGDINVHQPAFFKEISNMIQDTPVETWKSYLRWNLLNETARFLNSDLVNQDFYFYGTVLSGSKKIKSRWKRILQSTNNALGEAVGQLYVEKYFPPEAKARMLELVSNLKKSFKQRIINVEWMSNDTKKKALEKLDVMHVKIGYPDKWIDYSSLDIDSSSYLSIALRASNFNFKRDLEKIGKPVDRGEWHMTPQTVNAYYNPNSNEIVFPAAILQFPFFNMEADDAVNYGAIGFVIGHEMTHGFDDQGRLYDKNGNLDEWWNEQDAERFKQRTQVLVEQYNSFVAIDTMHVNGKLTLGENIADLGGLNISFAAMQMSFKDHQRPDKIDGFTPEQRFFLSAAQVWRQNIRDKELMRRIKEDVHSPGRFRVNGPIANMPEFHQAFQITEGDRLYKTEKERAKIW